MELLLTRLNLARWGGMSVLNISPHIQVFFTPVLGGEQTITVEEVTIFMMLLLPTHPHLDPKMIELMQTTDFGNGPMSRHLTIKDNTPRPAA